MKFPERFLEDPEDLIWGDEMPRIWTSCLLVLVAGAATAGFRYRPSVIYGDDNRTEIFEIADENVRSVADSTVAMIPLAALQPNGQGDVLVLSKATFSEAYSVCPSERFAAQPVTAVCSGFLVGEDLIATAGHCVNEFNCSTMKFAFGYQMLDATTARQSFAESEVYSCASVVMREQTRGQDYALVKLDRPVTNHKILKLSDTPVQPNDAIYVVGHPVGLPVKVSGGAKVRGLAEGYFTSNLDTYGGNSGSAVFNATTNEVVGILVRGERDFVYDAINQCSRSNFCGSDDCRGEDVTFISYIQNAMPK